MRKPVGEDTRIAVPKMKKAGDESPAVEVQFSMQITIHELLGSVKLNFQTLVDHFPVTP